MPESLHAELARASERAGMSLNAFITQTLSAAVQHRSAPSPSRPARAGGRRPRGLDRLLIANLVVVAVVGVLAAVLLVQAIR
jgi:HicB-like protein involved in pilus formation